VQSRNSPSTSPLRHESANAHIAPQFKQQIESSNLPSIFDDLVCALVGTTIGSILCFISRFALHSAYSPEETAEIRGISKASGVKMHVLIAFNVLLDLLLGCTSGGVRILESDEPGRVVHFRTLDWGMDQLRKIVVELDYVREEGGRVEATSITYFGYVGVLTGVRKGLSMSLNFRPRHDQSTWRKRFSFRLHQAMIVLGFRQSISSVLRCILLDPGSSTNEKNKEDAGDQASDNQQEGNVPEVSAILSNLSTSQSTSAYLIFCTPERVYVVEKDNRSASIRSSGSFLAAYNHDVSDEFDESELATTAEQIGATMNNTTGMRDLAAYSLERANHLNSLWLSRIKSCRRQFKREGQELTMGDVERFVRDREISNEETHYTVIMDPQSGRVIWRRSYKSYT
jgi:hypothetical protein